MAALDFSHFKKIQQDKKSATLVHPNGHEIKISVGNLSPALKKKLEELPLHQAKGSEEVVEPLDDESPAQIEEEIAAEAPQAQAAPVAPQAPVQSTPASVPAAPAPAPQAAPEAASVEEASSQPEAPSEPMILTATAPTPDEDAANKTKQNLLVGQDLNNNHIKPKTYRDLFNEKSTLGKVGTLFGLMLSGAGAGLTHQPNALMAMMDKQIANDLEAQKADQSNNQNWYKLSVDHLRADAQNDLERAHALDVSTEAERKQYANIENGVVDREASTQAKNNMRLAALHSNQLHINTMPQGPQRDNAQAMQNANMIAAQNAVHADNVKTAHEVKPMKDELNKLKQNMSANAKKSAPRTPEAEIETGPVDQHAYQNMLKKGKFMSTSGFVDPSKGIDPNDNAAVEKAITDSKVNWKNYKDVMEVTNALAKLPDAGQTPVGKLGDAFKKIPIFGETVSSLLHFGQASAERPRDVLVNALTQRLASGGASDKTIAEIRDALTPNMFDNEKTLKSLEETVYQHFAHNDKEQSGIWTKYPKIKRELPKISVDKEGALAKKSSRREGIVAGMNKRLKAEGMLEALGQAVEE